MTQLYDPTTIPHELKSVARWICWRADRKENGRMDKLPLDRYNPQRKVNSLSNCESWDAVFRKVSADASLGLGFYPDSPMTGLVGIDLDHVFDGPKVKLEALQIVDMLNSYTEFSPSGTGLHIWIRSEFSPENHNGKVLEIKSQGNSYLTVTGRIYGAFRPIEDRTEILRDLIDHYFPRTEEKTTKGKGNRIFIPVDDCDTLRKLWSNPDRARLWDGDMSAYGNDHSRADIALCNHIYWCSNCDIDAVDRLFRRSGLMRDKWDEVHNGNGLTYGQMTIQRVSAHK